MGGSVSCRRTNAALPVPVEIDDGPEEQQTELPEVEPHAVAEPRPAAESQSVAASTEKDEWVRVADGPPAPGHRLHTRLEGGRYATVVNYKGNLHCIDSICFHAGGPLGLGDIEDIEGHPCITCHWHSYKITLDTGEQMYQGVQPNAEGKLVKGEWRKTHQKQRIHDVEVRGDGLYVKYDHSDHGNMAVDTYACKDSCGVRMIPEGANLPVLQ